MYKITEINDTPCDLMIGYYWDKGGYEKSFMVVDNINKKQFVFERIYNPNEWADIRACECWVLDETVRKIVGADVMKYKSIRDGKGWGLVPIARLVHSDDLGQKYKRNYPVICEWMPEQWNAHTGANWNATTK